MVRMVGGLFLASAVIAWLMAIFGQWPLHVGATVSLMFGGLSWACVPWWMPEEQATSETAVNAPTVRQEQATTVIEPEPIEATAATGSVPAIMPEVLAPAKGKKTEIRRAYEAYALVCKRSGARAVPPVEFVPIMQTLCEMLHIETQRRGAYVYLVDVTLT